MSLQFRQGRKKKRGKFKISPERIVEANREMEAFSEMESYANLCAESASDEPAMKHFARAIVRRRKELERRGYPEEWIEKDLERLVEGI